MSLETVITANTAAIEKLIAVWTKLSEQTARIGTSFSEATPPVDELFPLPATKVASPAIQEAIQEAIQAPTPAATVIDYDTVSLAITTAVKTDRPKVIATLAAFGVAKGTELAADQYAAFLEALAA